MKLLNKQKWALLWALLIFVLCVIPGKHIPHISFLEFPHFDKLVHFGLFFVQAILTMRGFATPTISKIHLKAMLLSFLICTLYGGTLECIQGSWCTDRNADLYDFFADAAGSLLGIITFKKNRALLLKHP